MPNSSAPESPSDWKRHAVEYRRGQIAKLRATGDLPPPWVTCPQIPYGSIGWRMGDGECVMCDWRDWMHGLSRERFVSYCQRHGPRESWLAGLVRTFRILRSRITSTPRIVRTWSEWWLLTVPEIESELTTMTWDDYWDSKMREFETKYAA